METPKGVPPPTPKSKSVENLRYGQKAALGKDPYARMPGNYGKNAPAPQTDEY